jgi:hypothetical protein
MADAAPRRGGRHKDKIMTGRFRGKLETEAVQALRDEYAGM